MGHEEAEAFVVFDRDAFKKPTAALGSAKCWVTVALPPLREVVVLLGAWVCTVTATVSRSIGERSPKSLK
ncbi:MAG: hypothetical protein HC897_11940 [Thermoanaerobaculia bacterium]|nr:hypothetical protein [Thermoanaerobaculia bacterium]